MNVISWYHKQCPASVKWKAHLMISFVSVCVYVCVCCWVTYYVRIRYVGEILWGFSRLFDKQQCISRWFMSWWIILLWKTHRIFSKLIPYLHDIAGDTRSDAYYRTQRNFHWHCVHESECHHKHEKKVYFWKQGIIMYWETVKFVEVFISF